MDQRHEHRKREGTTVPGEGARMMLILAAVGGVVLAVAVGAAVIFLMRERQPGGAKQPPASGTSAPSPQPAAGKVTESPEPPPEAIEPPVGEAASVEQFNTMLEEMNGFMAMLDKLDADAEKEASWATQQAGIAFGKLGWGFRELGKIAPKLPLTEGERELLGLRLAATGKLIESKSAAFMKAADEGGTIMTAKALLEKEGAREIYEEETEKLWEHPTEETLEESLERIGVDEEVLHDLMKLLT